MGILHLRRRYPRLKHSLPTAELANLPTPVERASKLEQELGVDELWIKRDDLSGSLYGGNKTRKLELLYGKALRDHRGWVVTTGAWGSHHVLATTILGRKLGIRVCAVLVPQPPTAHVLENLLCTHSEGAHIVTVPGPAAVAPTMLFESLQRRAQLIPPGGSSPLGALAFVAAMFELAEQIHSGHCPAPERIYVALGSSGTQAGLVAGAALAGLSCQIIGVRVTAKYMANEHTVARLATATSRLLSQLDPSAPRLRFRPKEINVLHDQFGAGYGESTAECEQAIALLQDSQAITLDGTYTGKAMAGLIAEVRRRPARGPVMYWNTLSSVDLTPLIDRASPQGLPQRLKTLYNR